MKSVQYRVRPVIRHVVTRYTSEPGTGSGSVETLGEFDHESYAEQVAEALRRADAAQQRQQVGDTIIVNKREGGFATEAVIEAVHEWKGRRLLDVNFQSGTFLDGYGGGQVVDTGEGPYLLEPRSPSIDG